MQRVTEKSVLGQVVHTVKTYTVFHSIEKPGIFLLPLHGMLFSFDNNFITFKHFNTILIL